MTNLTENHINAHCTDLGITRDQLTEFTIPDGVTKIDDQAFILLMASLRLMKRLSDNAPLSSITIPDGVRLVIRLS